MWVQGAVRVAIVRQLLAPYQIRTGGLKIFVPQATRQGGESVATRKRNIRGQSESQ
jgi:hypothetical protein